MTAYVTLEPCCHYGQTPPCAASLVLAGADRVVVGFRDPNPRVDGGGVRLLQEAGIAVDVVPPPSPLADRCAQLVTDFCKRIAPRDEELDYAANLQGKHRRALRSLANRLQSEGRLPTVAWGGATVPVDAGMETALHAVAISPEWMEDVDRRLWQHELLLLRLNKAVAKKKGAKVLGERIADQLQAHVAQTKGHSVLLYRPGIPAVLDLEQLVAGGASSEEEKDGTR